MVFRQWQCHGLQTHYYFLSYMGKVGNKYDETVSSYNARLRPALRNIQKLQGVEEHVDKEMNQLGMNVKPLIEVPKTNEDDK